MRTRHVAALLGVLAVLLWSVPAQGQQPTKPSRDFTWVPVPVPSASMDLRLDERYAAATDRPASVRALPRDVGRPSVKLPANPAKLHTRGVPPSRRPSGRRVTGPASWYCWPSYPSACPKGYSGGMYAAAGPGLRAAICGNQASNCWRGRYVTVNGYSRPIKLVDWCQCYWKQPKEKLIDLFHDAWIATHASGGVVISW